MSIYAIKQYHAELEKLIHYGGSKNELSIRNAFSNLLDQYAESKDLKLIQEISLKTKTGKIVTPDGTLKDVLRLDHGYWESKDESDNLDDEIRKKFSKGYPSDNILFEDSNTAVLFQHGTELLRVPMTDGEKLDKLLNYFINFEREEVKEFRKAIEKFKEDIPNVTAAIHEIIQNQNSNRGFLKALSEYTELCKRSINPDITVSDIQEMMVQHILSADIFNTIFDEPHFHQENNIARELNKVISTFFIGSTRKETLGRIKHYYDTINAKAASIADHHEKQHFLKIVYENFYKAYNPKAADRLGIVYTPNEVVKFMVKSTDHLLFRHFGKTLDSKEVEILDPATGTGTFMCEIIDHLPLRSLEYKYKNELHANEVSILPYYIANLNIEYIYKQKTNQYAEFQNLCFVDTLDNTGYNWAGKQGDLFGVTAENAERIRRQNKKKISVIIGNPPYNANQQNENENNKNREYPAIDKRIKHTFIKNSTAQKTKMYDMYSRFYRWAMDRVDENGGIIAFITNRSFIDSRTFDGFRKTIQQDFDFAYIIDTKSDVRANPKIAGTTHNVFGIQAGVAILLLVKLSAATPKSHPCRIEYVSLLDEWRKEQKLQWFVEHPIENIQFEIITPDKNNNWLNITDNDWDSFIPVTNYETKQGKVDSAIFKLNSLGLVTSRDEWCFDFNKDDLQNKVEFFTKFYCQEQLRWNKSERNISINNFVDRTIKFGSELSDHLVKGSKLQFNTSKIRECSFRPFVKKYAYIDRIITHRLYQNENVWGLGEPLENVSIVFSAPNSNVLSLWCTDKIAEYKTIGVANGASQLVPLYCYTNDGKRIDNITDWALVLFQNHYQSEIRNSKFEITKENIFHYVYAVLHQPAYRKKYELNLKREFPRIPLYNNFRQWCRWGEELMTLHLNYETTAHFPLKKKQLANKEQPKVKLKALKETGIIQLDENTELHGIPSKAWEYKLGNRSALEWILDQYKEKKPSDLTIAEKFNTFWFADYKDKVIDLLKRVCTVSMETIKLINEMDKLS